MILCGKVNTQRVDNRYDFLIAGFFKLKINAPFKSNPYANFKCYFLP